MADALERHAIIQDTRLCGCTLRRSALFCASCKDPDLSGGQQAEAGGHLPTGQPPTGTVLLPRQVATGLGSHDTVVQYLDSNTLEMRVSHSPHSCLYL